MTEAKIINEVDLSCDVSLINELRALNDIGEVKDDFPIKALPKEIQEIVIEYEKNLGFVQAYVAATILWSVGLANGNAHRLFIKNGHTESSVLYMALVGRPGAGKTPPINTILNYIKNVDAEATRVYKEHLKHYREIENLPKDERDAAGFRNLRPPVLKKYLYSDFTIEAFLKGHENNLKGVGVYSDELSTFFANQNRYNSGSEASLHLSNYSGVPITIDRKNDNPIYIKHPHAPIIGGIQPGVLPEVFGKNSINNGLLDRWVFVWPLKAEKPYWNTNEMPIEFIEKWNSIISRIEKFRYEPDEFGNYQSQEIRFNSESWTVILEWQKRNTDLCNGSTDRIASIYSKLEIVVLRLSLILQILKWACGDESKDFVTAETAESAILLTEYFRGTALRVNELLTQPKSELLPSDKKQLYNSLPATFKTSEGLAVSSSLGMPERTFMTFLKDTSLFKKLKHGEYEKVQ